ncbi:permease of the major facilitator superfamily protein [Vibrio orientalis CIP 102891 = ATCC 33934]|uniref:Permease of the major facilitator superfamily protein n=1 Tax=Vibrio orientalis CIP 102891 = ATCC 33934 TaxID=675816 RepID=C9QEK0_VIBOR|nr:hypothetical protein VIA_001633 [Vibrio orientalis CIP 102891 = ATCC 33934]EGU53976.1 permease of the major facilitator superfamily protein [Vibrio orientalis CIP 102891 = ATCC 33934]
MVSETVGPVLSGALLLVSAIHNVFLLVAFLLLLAFWQLEKLEFTHQPMNDQRNLFDSLKEGWQILRAEHNMWQITLAVMVINTTGAVFWIQAIYYGKAELALSAIEVSYLIAASGFVLPLMLPNVWYQCGVYLLLRSSNSDGVDIVANLSTRNYLISRVFDDLTCLWLYSLSYIPLNRYLGRFPCTKSLSSLTYWAFPVLPCSTMKSSG